VRKNMIRSFDRKRRFSGRRDLSGDEAQTNFSTRVTRLEDSRTTLHDLGQLRAGGESY